MPHLQGQSDAKKDEEPPPKDSTSEVREDGRDKPDEEGEDAPANPLLSFASAATTQAQKDKKEDTVEDAPQRPAGPPGPRGQKSAITPSPAYPYRAPYDMPPPYYAYPPPPPPPGAYGRGGTQLFNGSPSRRHTHPDDQDAKEDGTERPPYDDYRYPPHRPPPYGPYAMPPPYPYPHPYYDPRYARPPPEESTTRKRPADEEPDAPEEKRTKVQEAEKETSEESETKDEGDGGDESKEESGEEESKKGKEVTEKDGSKRIISPASSLDGTHATGKGEATDSPSVNYKQRRSTDSYPPGESRPPAYDPWAYHSEAYPYGPPKGPYYPPYYPPAGYYPPPPHYGEGPPRGWGGYPPPPEGYPPHPYHSRAHDSRPSPPEGYERSNGSPPKSDVEEVSPKNGGGEATVATSAPPEIQADADPTLTACGPTGSPKKITSVADWQTAHRATGMAPSANRCVPLQEPIPSKCWGSLEHAEKLNLPDFHRLVNFPDYLIKNYPDYLRKNRTKGAKSAAPTMEVDKNGKRHCVMCGQARRCSASSAKTNPSTRVRVPEAKKKQGDEEDEGSDSDTMHIIPRQNKGLCTACDVTVWVIADTNLEIKWCKGCKNFRPWAAFGDKGMATKCVRCRDRQREKYASQKDKLRVHRQIKKAAASSGGDDGGPHELAAARGLRDLMEASV